ncbi:RNB domain-containing ribonuclease [Salininema proteolyticum]|uniref:RNB domain-containing ribonuclease n=1 Tax=Salininema proteolyticum TaxID=1607685 RepID=A0ABV8U1H1_9ACTN
MGESRQQAGGGARALPGIMIDSATTKDRDDAVWVEARSDGGFDLWVHVAAAADAVPWDSSADMRARERMHTRYGRTRTRSMLPERVEKSASLREAGDETQSTLAVHARLDASATVVSREVFRGAMTRAHAISYEEAAAATDDPAHALHRPVALADTLARRLLDQRRANGALAFYDLNSGFATDEDGRLVRLETTSRNSGYIVVQEFMILANYLIAEWAAETETPLLFRNHRMSPMNGSGTDLRRELDEVALSGDAESYNLLRARLRLVASRAGYGTVIGGHHGLQLPYYTHATSPLRRYADLVNQRIIFDRLDGRDAHYDFERLEELGEDLTERLHAEKEEKSEYFRTEARRMAAAKLESGDYSGLDTSEFNRVLKVALADGEVPAELIRAASGRYEAGRLELRDMAEIYFAQGHPEMERLRGRINADLADESFRAPTMLNWYLQEQYQGPILPGDLTWNESTTPVKPVPLHSASVTVRLGEGFRTSPERRRHSKKEARSQAVLALLAELAGLEDLSADAGAPGGSENVKPVPDGLEAVQIATIYASRRHIRDLDFAFKATKDAASRFRCKATAVIEGGEGEGLETLGEGPSKKAAKKAAAAELNRLVEERLGLSPTTPAGG